MKSIYLLLLLCFVATSGLVSCAKENMDYGHRTNYWNRRHPQDHYRERYYYPKYNKDNRPRYNSNRF